MTKDKALDLALEALEKIFRTYYHIETPPIESLEEKMRRIADKAITAIKQARALDKKAENAMIYKTFEQWKSGNVLEHGVPRTEHYSEDQLDLVEMGWNYGYDAGRAVEQALDKKAENARELGLDYEPVAKLQVTLQDRPIDIELAQYKRMFESACSALGAIGDALGCDPEEGGAEPILAAIAELKATTPAAPVQEPTATVTSESGNPDVTMSWWHEPALPVGTKLYTTPPAAQRQWIGLTAEERTEIAGFAAISDWHDFEVIDAVETKLKEKNT